MARPPAETPVLRLKPASRGGVGSAIGYQCFFLAFLVGTGTGMLVSGLFRDPGAEEASRLAQLVLGAGLLALAILPGAHLRDHLRAFRERDPHVRVVPDGITISDSGVFVEPQLISTSVIREVVVGPGVTRSFGGRPRRRRTVLLAVQMAVPNAVIDFREPVLLDRAYGPFPTYPGPWIAHPPSWDEPVEAVWLTFEDPEAAYSVLQDWSVPVRWAEA